MCVLLSGLVLHSGCKKQSDFETQSSLDKSSHSLLARSSSDHEILPYEEDENFLLHEEYSNLFGYSSIEINSGIYSIRYDEEANQYYTELTIAGLGEQVDAGDPKVGIRIAKRICNAHKKSCCCGVGFRCGFVTSVEESSQFNDVALIEGFVDEENGVLVVTFQEVESPDYFFELEEGKYAEE